MRRPFHLVGVAHGRRRVEVSLDCPPQHELARLLCDLSKIDERLVGGFHSGFFRELSPSHRHELLTRLHLALGDRPVADVLLHPERSALMGQEHLQATLPAAPEQDPGARAPRFVGRHTHLLARASGSRHIFSGPPESTKTSSGLAPLTVSSCSRTRSRISAASLRLTDHRDRRDHGSVRCRRVPGCRPARCCSASRSASSEEAATRAMSAARRSGANDGERTALESGPPLPRR